jgi:hypothetical protein
MFGVIYLILISFLSIYRHRRQVTVLQRVQIIHQQLHRILLLRLTTLRLHLRTVHRLRINTAQPLHRIVRPVLRMLAAVHNTVHRGAHR